ncbi:MAG: hypothetical protein EB140_16000 [Proteobacteria bacterium]|nr:hypothetical protein [Pseudomonadota bacterium]
MDHRGPCTPTGLTATTTRETTTMAATTTEMTTATTPIEIMLKDATSARQATIEVLPDVTFTELLASAKDAWSLPDGYEYIIRVARLGRQVVLSHTIQAIGIRDHDVLEIQAQGVAGSTTLAPSAPIEIILKDATSARQNIVDVLPDVTFTELLKTAKDVWALPEFTRGSKTMVCQSHVTKVSSNVGCVLPVQSPPLS